MRYEILRRVVCRRPTAVIAAWFLLAATVGLAAPSLTRLAAEGEANLLPKDAESVRVQEIVARAWPDQSSLSMAVVALQRTGKLTPDDSRFARRLVEFFQKPGRP